jgi:hypothetical protein
MARSVGGDHAVYIEQPQPDLLVADMRPSEVVEVLAGLRFNAETQQRTIRLDKGVRDFLVAAVTARCGKA